MDGLEVLTQLRRNGISTPVLFLSAKGEVEDRVAGLNAGADDYLPKPFATSEFVARVRALSRRTVSYSPATIFVGLTSLDCDCYELSHANKPSSVTLEITNNSNVALENVNLTSSVPDGWTATFSQATIDKIDAGATVEVTATVTPSKDAMACRSFSF